MRTHTKILACAAVASTLLFACNDNGGGPNSSNVDDNNTSTGGEVNASSGDDNNPSTGGEVSQGATQTYDPSVLIADDVEKWMAGQLASKSGEKRIIGIYDMYLPNFESEAGLYATIDSDGKTEYFINGEKVSFEEYHRKWEYERQRAASYNGRNLSVPGEIISESYRRWIVLITAEELAEWVNKYDQLSISFYIEPQEE